MLSTNSCGSGSVGKFAKVRVPRQHDSGAPLKLKASPMEPLGDLFLAIASVRSSQCQNVSAYCDRASKGRPAPINGKMMMKAEVKHDTVKPHKALAMVSAE